MKRVILWGGGLGVFCALALAFAYGVIGLPAPGPGPVWVAPARSLDAPKGRPARILLVGTSLSVTDWPKRLAAQGTPCGAALDVEVIARPGAASDWGWPQLDARLAQAPSPDLVLVEFSVNDASPWNGFPLWTSRRLHRQIVARVEAAGLPLWLATMNPGWGRNGLERPGQDRYHGIYRDLAASTPAGLIDTIGIWRALPAPTRQILVPDGLHPTPQGMDQVILPAFGTALAHSLCGAALPASGPKPGG